MSTACILIVEDDFLMAEWMRDVCEGDGFSVAGPVADVKIALRMLDLHAVNAALLDVDLDGETSAPIADALARQRIPFVFVTGGGSEDLPAEHRNAPMLRKPASRDSLLGGIRAVLG